MNLKNIAFLLLIVLFGYFLPGLTLSVVILIFIFFKKESFALLIHLYHSNWEELKQFYYPKKRQLRNRLIYTIAFIAVFNLFFFVIEIGQGRDEESGFYRIPAGIVEIKASTFSLAHNDNGQAKVFISINDNKKLEINSSFNYDFFDSKDAVYVRYGFYNLDLIPDITITTDAESYFVSGFTGNLYKKESIKDHLKK
jgi:preprotein translocase subunit SecE